jgi:hypothetical protein
MAATGGQFLYIGRVSLPSRGLSSRTQCRHGRSRTDAGPAVILGTGGEGCRRNPGPVVAAGYTPSDSWGGSSVRARGLVLPLGQNRQRDDNSTEVR